MRSVLLQAVMNSIFPGSWSHWLFPRFSRSTQFGWFLTAGYPVISSHALPTLLEPEPLFLTNSGWMPRKVRCESRHIFAAYVHIVLVSHGDTTSIISRYITCSSICALASISDLRFGIWDDGERKPGTSGSSGSPRDEPNHASPTSSHRDSASQ
jgi:hypothetical protein